MSRAIPADATTPWIVARYMSRPPITPERMLGEADQDRIIYRSDAVHPRHQTNFRVFDPVDFLAEVSAHIPDAHEKTTLFYGWDSHRRRGYRKQRELIGDAHRTASTPEMDEHASPEARRSWARLIRHVYEVDPLLCPRCGGTTKIISVIERPAIVRQILDHLGLPTTAPRLRAPPDPPKDLAAERPREWSYGPLFDDLLIPGPGLA